ncbi:MAG: BREX-3 system P-loop-containing protein BrxF [Balneolales bacterium]|nr:BREX-3 system P-loop-containing protein BrxF [Balneolales bacterium]
MAFFKQDNLLQAVREADMQFYRLVLIVGPRGAGKTKALQGLADRLGLALMNLNQLLSEKLLHLSAEHRVMQLPALLDELLSAPSQPVLLDNTEILFDAGLRQMPLQLLQQASRNRTLVVAWNGRFEDSALSYAVPGHREHRRYASDHDATIVPAINAVLY